MIQITPTGMNISLYGYSIWPLKIKKYTDEKPD